MPLPITYDPALVPEPLAANIFEGLARLDDNLAAVPAAARAWRFSRGATRVTFVLRRRDEWTNGDPVTASDFEYSWKRVLDPATKSWAAYLLFGVRGARAYNACRHSCEELRDRVGIHALGPYTLRVDLAYPQPWFPALAASIALLAVPREAVERYGETWMEPGHIVSNGPFRVVSAVPDKRLVLERWNGWRDADGVKVRRVQVRTMPSEQTAAQFFVAGKADVGLNIDTGVLPPADRRRLETTRTGAPAPSVASTVLAVNTDKIPDVHQRRAMALALDRVTLTGDLAATSYTPPGIPGAEVIQQHFLRRHADLAGARHNMSLVKRPQLRVELWTGFNDAGTAEQVRQIAASWRQIGIRTDVKIQEWEKFLQLLGPPPSPRIDVFLYAWSADYPDDENMLQLWTCRRAGTSTNYCDPSYDRLLEHARRLVDALARQRIYAALEAKLVGPQGAFPIIPLYWPAAGGGLVQPSVRRTFRLNPFGMYDLTSVVVER